MELNDMRKTRNYTKVEKEQILQEVKDIGNIAAVAKKNKIPSATIHTWIKPKPTKKAKSILPDYQVSELKKQLKDYELENKILKEILKKSIALWPEN